jgi:hypothetical protein
MPERKISQYAAKDDEHYQRSLKEKIIDAFTKPKSEPFKVPEGSKTELDPYESERFKKSLKEKTY